MSYDESSGARAISCYNLGDSTAWMSNWRSLQWRHNERYGVPNHQRLSCLFNRLFRRRSKKTSKLRVFDLCEGNWPASTSCRSIHLVCTGVYIPPFRIIIVIDLIWYKMDLYLFHVSALQEHFFLLDTTPNVLCQLYHYRLEIWLRVISSHLITSVYVHTFKICDSHFFLVHNSPWLFIAFTQPWNLGL